MSSSSVLKADEIFSKYKGAVVTVLASYTIPEDTSFQLGNGFIIQSDPEVLIVTASQNISSPSGIARSPTQPSPPGPDFAIYAVIYVYVYDIGEKKESFIYQGNVVGVDGASNVALIKISCLNQWNLNLPNLKCQPHFKFQDSNKYSTGKPCYTIFSDYNFLGSPSSQAVYLPLAIFNGITSQKRASLSGAID